MRASSVSVPRAPAGGGRPVPPVPAATSALRAAPHDLGCRVGASRVEAARNRGPGAQSRLCFLTAAPRPSAPPSSHRPAPTACSSQAQGIPDLPLRESQPCPRPRSPRPRAPSATPPTPQSLTRFRVCRPPRGPVHARLPCLESSSPLASRLKIHLFRDAPSGQQALPRSGPPSTRTFPPPRAPVTAPLPALVVAPTAPPRGALNTHTACCWTPGTECGPENGPGVSCESRGTRKRAAGGP